MPFNNFGVSNLSRVQQQTQQDNPETVTTILGSNIIFGKRGGEEGITHLFEENVFSLVLRIIILAVNEQEMMVFSFIQQFQKNSLCMKRVN